VAVGDVGGRRCSVPDAAASGTSNDTAASRCQTWPLWHGIQAHYLRVVDGIAALGHGRLFRVFQVANDVVNYSW